MDKTNFLLYKDFKPNIDILSNEQAGKLFKAVFAYVQDRTEPDFENDGMLLMAFTMLKTTLERDLKKYKKQVEINKVNGKKGGRPPKKDKETQSVNDKQNKPSGLNENRNNPSEPKKADSDSVTDSVSDSEIDKKDKDTMSSKHDHVPYNEIKEHFNSFENLPSIRTLSKKRKDKIKLRIDEVGLDDFKKAIKMCSESSFLSGNNDRGWIVDIDWIIENDTNIIKILEGKYNKNKVVNDDEYEEALKNY